MKHLLLRFIVVCVQTLLWSRKKHTNVATRMLSRFGEGKVFSSIKYNVPLWYLVLLWTCIVHGAPEIPCSYTTQMFVSVLAKFRLCTLSCVSWNKSIYSHSKIFQYPLQTGFPICFLISIQFFSYASFLGIISSFRLHLFSPVWTIIFTPSMCLSLSCCRSDLPVVCTNSYISRCT